MRMAALLFAFGTFLSTLGGGLFGIRYRDQLYLIISFTAGVLVALVFFEVIPEMLALTTQQTMSVTPAMAVIVSGFFVFHIVEKAALLHSAQEGKYVAHTHPLVGYVGASGLAFHSVLDGVGIGLGFQVSPHTGVIIALAVIAHDFSDGLNTVSLMLLNKHTVRKSLLFLVIDALAPLFGVGTTYFFLIPAQLLVFYLEFFAGSLLYIGATELLPEAHSQLSSFTLVALTLAGVLYIFLVTHFR